MRLFAGIDIPDPLKDRLDELVRRLRPKARLRWSPVHNLHITTKFIGEWPEERLEELKAALRTVNAAGPVKIAIRGLGWFPNPHHPRVFWVGVHAPPELAALATESDHVLATLGIEPEKRAFSPHLTLARISEPVDLAPLRKAVADLDSADFGSFTADCWWLYHSRLAPGGSVYTKLADYPLKGRTESQ
jgi:RNA 2',3'-cyclic 3'-phosphodiesterase